MLGGTRVVVDVAFEAEAQDASAIEKRLRALLAELDAVVDGACEKLSDLYNDSWSEETGFTATPAGMKRKVRLRTISLSAVSWRLYFTDAKLFGGHTIEVWRARRRIEVNLLG